MSSIPKMTSSMAIIIVMLSTLLLNQNVVLGYVGEMTPFDWDLTNCSNFPFTNIENNNTTDNNTTNITRIGSDGTITPFYKCGILEYCTVPNPLPFDERVGYRQYGTTNPCFSPGPLIRVEPGKKYLLSFYNNIPGDKSNIHTHGLHISGDGNGDNSLRSATSAGCLHYVWDVPANHLGGTHWYHSHKHEFSRDQVSRGANGMIIVEDNYNTLFPEEIKNNVTQMNRLITFFQNEYQFMAGNINFRWNGNGIRGGVQGVTIIQNEWTRIRMSTSAAIQSDPGVNYLFARISSSFICPDAFIIAFDGVYTFELPLYKLPQEITGASRIDIALRCTRIGEVKLTFDTNPIATFNVIEGIPKIASPFIDDDVNATFNNNKTWSPVRPNYLRDLRNETPTNYYNISLGDYKINGIKWDPVVPIATFNLNDLNEMKLFFTINHPFHSHIQHMQTVFGCGKYKLGEFYDTIASTNSDCVVRISFDDYAGINLIHCHDLEHEDGGMMAFFNVLNDTMGTIQKTNPDPDDGQCFLPVLATSAPITASSPVAGPPTAGTPTAGTPTAGPPTAESPTAGTPTAPVPAPTSAPPPGTCTTCASFLGLSGKMISRSRFGRCIQRCSLFSGIRVALGWTCGACAPALNDGSDISIIDGGSSNGNVILLPSNPTEDKSETCDIQYKCMDTLGSMGYYIRRYHGENGKTTCQDICQSASILKFALSMGDWECGPC